MRKFLVILLGTTLLNCSDADDKPNNGDSVENNATNNQANNQNNENNQNNDNNNPLPIDPGVPLDTSSNDLDDNDRTRICDELSDHLDDLGLPESTCLFTVYPSQELADASDVDELRQLCTDRMEACVDSLSGARPSGNFCSPASNCTGTVEEGISCVIGAAEDQIGATESIVSCDEITFGLLGSVNSVSQPPSPECAQFNATCN